KLSSADPSVQTLGHDKRLRTGRNLCGYPINLYVAAVGSYVTDPDATLGFDVETRSGESADGSSMGLPVGTEPFPGRGIVHDGGYVDNTAREEPAEICLDEPSGVESGRLGGPEGGDHRCFVDAFAEPPPQIQRK